MSVDTLRSLVQSDDNAEIILNALRRFAKSKVGRRDEDLQRIMFELSAPGPEFYKEHLAAFKLRNFTREDWYGFSGAESFSEGEPPLMGEAEFKVDGHEAMMLVDKAGIAISVNIDGEWDFTGNLNFDAKEVSPEFMDMFENMIPDQGPIDIQTADLYAVGFKSIDYVETLEAWSKEHAR